MRAASTPRYYEKAPWSLGHSCTSAFSTGCSGYLEPQNNCPDKAEGQSWVAVDDVVSSHVLEVNSLFIEECQWLVNVLKAVNAHLSLRRIWLHITCYNNFYSTAFNKIWQYEFVIIITMTTMKYISYKHKPYVCIYFFNSLLSLRLKPRSTRTHKHTLTHTHTHIYECHQISRVLLQHDSSLSNGMDKLHQIQQSSDWNYMYSTIWN